MQESKHSTGGTSLIIVCGNAGVGKTTYGRKLAAKLSATFLDIDTVSERLVQAGLEAAGLDPNDRDSPRYKRVFRDAIHETLFNIAKDNIQHQSCVIVAPLTQERRDPLFLERCQQQFKVQVEIYYLTCSDDLRRARIVQRANPRDQSKLNDWMNYSAQGQDPTPPPFTHTHIRTDT